MLVLLNGKAGRRERARKGVEGGSAVQAGKMLTRLRTFFGWAAAHDLVRGDPTAGVRRPAKEAQRDRVLTDDEIRLFWAGTEAVGAPFSNLFRLLLLTAQREGEVAGMRWSELDLAGGTWTIPGERAKNGKPHIVHLSGLALEAVEAVPHVKGQDLLFSGSGSTPVSGFSRAKARLDDHMRTAFRASAGDAAAEIPPWVLHDLRRTATTGMARLGIGPHIADKVLNHTAGMIRGVAAVYNRFEYLDDRKAALNAWGTYIEGLIERRTQNIVPLRAAAAV